MTQKILSQKSPSEQSDSDLQNANRIASAIKKAKTIERFAKNPKAIASQEGLVAAMKILKQANQSKGYDFNQLPAPELWEQVKKIPDYKGCPPEALYPNFPNISDINKGKINALLTVDETNLWAQDFFVFEKVGEAFNNRIPKFDSVSPLSPGECAWTFNVIAQLRATAEELLTLEVKAYIATCLFQQGYLIPPKSLGFVKGELEKLTKLTDTERLQELYSKRIIHDNSEVLDRQLKKLAACDHYVSIQAVSE